MKEINVTITNLNMLERFMENFFTQAEDNNFHDVVNLTIEIFMFDQSHQRTIENYIKNLLMFTKNIYITLISNSGWKDVPHKKLIEIIPTDAVVQLEVLLSDNPSDSLNKLDFSCFKNLKRLSLKNFYLGKAILDKLDWIRVCPKLEEIRLSSTYTECSASGDSTAEFLENFLIKSIKMIKDTSLIKIFEIEHMVAISKAIQIEPYKNYYQQMQLLLQDSQKRISIEKCNSEKLKKHYERLQFVTQETNEIEKALKQSPHNIKLQALYNASLKEQEDTQADFIALLNFLIEHNIVDAKYYLAEFVQLSAPKQAYELLFSIPSSCSFFEAANCTMAHLLLDFKTCQIIFPRISPLTRNRKIIDHLLLSGDNEKPLLANMMHEYLYGKGLVGDDNIFLMINSLDYNRPTAQALFILDVLKQSESTKKFVSLKKSNSMPNILKPKFSL